MSQDGNYLKPHVAQEFYSICNKFPYKRGDTLKGEKLVASKC